MSKADRTAFGRPFAPMIAVSNAGNKPSYASITDNWNEFIEPYRTRWAHPDDGIEFGIYLHVLYWSGFYVNDNTRPSNPTAYTDPNYDWSYLDAIHTEVAALADGRAKLHFRLDTESSGVPDFLTNRGDTFPGTGDRPVPAWHRASVRNDMIDFLTAMAARYNGASWLAGLSFEEDNPGPNPPSDYTQLAWVQGRAATVRHAYNLFTKHTIFLAQSSGVHEQLTDIPVGRFMDDTKPGAFGCGSANQAYPIFDCTDGVLRGIQDYNGTIANPPGGLPKPTWSSSMPNGWGSRNDGNYGASNPWGTPYPIAGETSVPQTPAADPDWNAVQFLSYIAGEPRAPSPLNDSGLGQPGKDNAGVIPSMVVLVNPVCDTPQSWNRAFTLFGGEGTRACPAVPHDWFTGSGEPPATWWKPPLGSTWTYQITGTVDETVDVNNYIIDLFDADAALVSRLHSDSRKVYAYFSAGTWEDWRPDAGDYPGSVIGNQVEGWPDENWLDARALSQLRPRIQARLQMAVDKGFDGVDTDNMDSYQNNPGFPTTASDQVAFNRMVAEEAHALGLSCGLKNAVDLIPQLVGNFDFCVNEEGARYNEMISLLPFVNAGKSVFNVEYRSQDIDCEQANSLGIYQVLKTLDLDSTRTPCTGFGTPPGGGGGSGNEITVIVGFSTTEQWLVPMMDAHTNTNLIAVIVGGGDIDYWNTGSNMADGVEESYSSNQGNKEDGDVVFFQVAGPQRSAAAWDSAIETALTNIRAIFSTLTRITLAPSPGGPNGSLCPSDGPNNINGSVRDSVTYNEIRSAIQTVAARYTDVDWVDCTCDSCSWYSDGIGHITTSGGALLGEKMWNALFASLPPPSEVIANPDTLSQVAKNSGAILIPTATLLGNDTGNALSITSVSNATNCTVTLDTGNGRVNFTPAADFSGNATFRYTLSGDGGTSSTQVTVPVGNLPPTLNITWSGPGIRCNAGAPVSIGVQGLDPDGDTLSYQIDRQPDEGVLEINPVSGQPYWLMTYTSLVTSAGLVTGGQVSCTDSSPTNPLKSNIVNVIFDVVPATEVFTSITMDEDQATHTPVHIYGVTIDDISSLSSLTDAISSLRTPTTTRIVFDEGETAASYRTAFDAIKAVGDVMGEILDSSAMLGISVAAFETRVDQYLAEFGNEVDIWEIGNEVNGDWLGSTASVVDKIEYAYDAVVAIGGTTALTLYYNDACNSGADEMFTWAEANINSTMKAGLDYVLVSYWEEDCANDRPDWNSVFTTLGTMFPNSLIGFSEVGSEGNAATRAEFMTRYHSLAITHPRYIGGHFWWYFKTDCVPKTKALWTTLETALYDSRALAHWSNPAASIPGFGNVQGADWQVFRAQLHADHIAVTAPSNASAGDTLLVIAACDGSLAVDMVMDPSAGWVNRVNIHESGSSVAVFDKVLTSSEPGSYNVRKGTASEEWCAFTLVLPAGSRFDTSSETSGISTTAVAPSLIPTAQNVMTLFVVASDDPDTTEDAYSFASATMIGNKWSSNTGGMVMLALGYDTQAVVQASGARNLTLDIDGRWTGLTLAYTQQLSGYSGAYGADTLLANNGDGSGRVCYSTSADASSEKNWLRVYAQWPSSSIGLSTVRATLSVGGLTYAEVFVDQSSDGGLMNQIYNIANPLPAGEITLCIYDNADGPVFADAVRFDYSIGEQGFITFTQTIGADGVLKANKTLTTQAQAYVLASGGALFSYTKTCTANALVARPQDTWTTLPTTAAQWSTIKSKQ